MAEVTSSSRSGLHLPERDAPCCSRLTFSWLTGLMRDGAKKAIGREDVWETHKEDSSEKMTQRLQTLLDLETAKGTRKRRRLLWALARLRGYEWLCCALLKFTGESIAYLQPVILSSLISHIEAKNIDTTAAVTSSLSPFRPLLLSLGLIAIMFSRTFIMAYYVNLTCRISLSRRTAFMGVVMKKVLSMPSTMGVKNIGVLMNIVGNDAEKMSLGSRLSQNFWFQPVAVVICMSLLVYYIGYAAYVGLGVMILMLPLQVFLAKQITSLRRKLLKESDLRVDLVSDLIQGVRAIKLLVWMPFVLKKIESVRRAELQRLRSYLLISMLNYLFLTMVPILIASMTFAAFVALGHEIKASTAFTALSLLNMLRGPLFMFPRVLNAVLDGLIGVERASRLLTMNAFSQQSFKSIETDKRCGILVESEDFSWGAIPTFHTRPKSTRVQDLGLEEEKESITPNLTNISLSMRPGELGIIVGAVGSGKTTLLCSLLGECPCVIRKAADDKNGKVSWRLADDEHTSRQRISGTVAFVPQVPFIFIATAQDNILFGKPFDAKFYNEVVDACSLQADFELFPSGDATEIGERGINLSGGQKMRLSLARALYSDADVYLLDDPLAAVDQRTAAHIWTKGIINFLHKRGKVVLMTTNNVKYLSNADKMFLVEKCNSGNASCLIDSEVKDLEMNLSSTIIESGTVEEAQSKGGRLSELLKSGTDTRSPSGGDSKTKLRHENSRDHSAAIGGSNKDNVSSDSIMPEVLAEEKKETVASPGSKIPDTATHTKAMLMKGKLTSEENQEKGAVKKRTWLAYFDAVGWWLCIFILFLYALREAAKVGMDLWMANWSDASTGNITVTTTRMPKQETLFYLWGYLSFALAALLASIVRSVALLFAAVYAARITFARLIKSLSRAPMSWYDQTPAGRILNRVSSDQQRVDERVPQLIRDTTDTVFRVFGTVVLTAVLSPYFLVVLPIVAVLFYHTQLMYRRTTRELKRMDSTSRSPIYNNFNGALSGLDVLKSSDLCSLWLKKHHDASDDNFRFGYLVLTSSRWGSIRFEMIGHLLVIFVTAYISIVSALEFEGGLSPGLAGAALMNVLLINRLLLNLTRSGVELEIGFNAMERLDYYATQLPSEAPETDEELDVKTEGEWPTKGAVQFSDVCLRYRDNLPDVLNGVSFELKPGEKIGLCGRTGSGKSTIALALFRMVECRSGSIEIDGINIASRGLSKVRSSIAIVPQSPTLFEGTIRYNLDPHGQHSDSKILEALKKVQLLDVVQDTGKGLNAVVDAGGLNWSVGQRQLLCLARAICTEAKVLVLDECSASIDLETDEKLQAMIREEFKSSTVITIAHRLDTIMHCDKVLVMDAGLVAEFDAPRKLIEEHPDGIFASFVRNGSSTGTTSTRT